MKLQELITVENRYQDSVNIRLDLNSSQKVEQYIPTTASIQVLHHYLDNIIENKENATMLIGPYGKGKSHLILILMKLLWMEEDSVTKEKIKELMKRVKKVDPKTAELMTTISKTGKPYLPVVVTYGNEELNTTYYFALDRALKMAGLTNVAPDSAYQKAINAILGWKKDFPIVYNSFDKALQEQKKVPACTNAECLVTILRDHNKAAYELFESMYPQFTAGSRFTPMVEMNAMKLYEEVNSVLRKEYGYAGMFIVFDEFSKYIEMQDKESSQLSGNMDVVQNMCELCSKRDNHMHQIFVAHKSIKEYGDYLSTKTLNTFTGVEGRLKEVHFTTSIKNSYELISHTISKKERKWKSFLKEGDPLVKAKEAYQLPAFYSTFSKKDFEDVVVKGCFPLLPAASYLLLKISERVGQNERSLFTFLAKKEPFTLLDFIKKEANQGRCEDLISYVDASAVYDYFSSLFYKEMTIPHIQEEYKKAQYVLDHIEDDAEEKIVKALALLLMIHIPEEMNADKKSIFLCCNLEYDQYEKALKNLVENGYIVFRERKGSFEFKNQISVNINKEIEQYKLSLGKIKLEEELGKISSFRYELPKSYNHEFSMTRYFDYVFLNREAFLKLNNKIIDGLFEEHFSDGKIIAIVSEKNEMMDSKRCKEEVHEKMKSLDCNRIVVLEPTTPLDIRDLVMNILAIMKMQKVVSEQDEKDSLLLEELSVLLEDAVYMATNRLETIYMPYNGHCNLYFKEEKYEVIKDRKEFNQILSEILRNHFSNTPKIQHEMVNRRHVSTPMKNARTKILEALLNHSDTSVWEKGTSSEATMFRATLLHTGMIKPSGNTDFSEDSSALKEVMDNITMFLKEAEKKKCKFSQLYAVLQGEGYGLRSGVIPIYLAYRFAQLSDLPVVYLKRKEYPLSASILNQINVAPQDFSLFVEKNTIEKEEYLLQLAQIWECEADVTICANEIWNWFQALSQYAKRGSYEDQTAVRLCEYLLRNMQNPREFLFDSVPQLCESIDYLDCIEKLKRAKDIIDHHLDQLYENVVVITRQLFSGKKEDSLGALVSDWYYFLNDQMLAKIHNAYESAFLKAVEEIAQKQKNNAGHLDDYTIISRLSKVLTDLYMEDWKDDTCEYYKKQLSAMIESFTIVKEKELDKKEISFLNNKGERVHKYFDDEIDGTAEFLQNEMLSVMEEFGDSVEPEQKVAVLMKLMEEIL